MSFDAETCCSQIGSAPLAEQGKKVREALIESLVWRQKAQEMSPPSTRDPGAGSDVRVLRVEMADFDYAFNTQYLSQEGSSANRARIGSCVYLQPRTQGQQVANGPFGFAPSSRWLRCASSTWSSPPWIEPLSAGRRRSSVTWRTKRSSRKCR